MWESTYSFYEFHRDTTVSPSQIQIFDPFLVNISFFPYNLILNSKSHGDFEYKLICQSQ